MKNEEKEIKGFTIIIDAGFDTLAQKIYFDAVVFPEIECILESHASALKELADK